MWSGRLRCVNFALGCGWGRCRCIFLLLGHWAHGGRESNGRRNNNGGVSRAVSNSLGTAGDRNQGSGVDGGGRVCWRLGGSWWVGGRVGLGRTVSNFRWTRCDGHNLGLIVCRSRRVDGRSSQGSTSEQSSGDGRETHFASLNVEYRSPEKVQKV